MRIHAFTGTRFSQAGGAGELAGPPYDQIDENLRCQLQQNPHHFAHLIRPVGGNNPHREAAELHATWLATGVIAIESDPALYPYEILLPNDRRRLGITALVGLEPESSPIIRPHEATVARTVDERLSLLRETRIDLEPILVLADDAGQLNQMLEKDLGKTPFLVQHEDSEGRMHRLYRIDDRQRIAEYQARLEPCVGLIADGHHRYTVAQRFVAEQESPVVDAAGAKLAVLTSLESPGLQIDPIHRQLSQPVNFETAAHLASSRRSLSTDSARAIAEAVASSPQPTLGITTDGRTELWGFDAGRAPDSLPGHLHHLTVGWLHDALLPALGLDSQAATDGTIGYRSQPERLLTELRTGSATVGFWLPPMSGQDFARAMAGGELLPPKSTRFLPKVASGLVWSGHDSRLL